MKHLLATCLLSTAAAATVPANAALREGDTAPAFRATASLAGKAFDYSLRDALARGPVVVYFYPAAFTIGCSLQAHAFAVNTRQFSEAGASIIGVSLDRIERLNAFSADPESCAGTVAVASDAKGAIAKSFDLAVREQKAGSKTRRGDEIGHGLAERTTFVIRPDGRIAATLSGLSPEENVARALDAVRALK
jgi:peroxiredoxin